MIYSSPRRATYLRNHIDQSFSMSPLPSQRFRPLCPNEVVFRIRHINTRDDYSLTIVGRWGRRWLRVVVGEVADAMRDVCDASGRRVEAGR